MVGVKYAHQLARHLYLHCKYAVMIHEREKTTRDPVFSMYLSLMNILS